MRANSLLHERRRIRHLDIIGADGLLMAVSDRKAKRGAGGESGLLCVVSYILSIGSRTNTYHNLGLNGQRRRLLHLHIYHPNCRGNPLPVFPGGALLIKVVNAGSFVRGNRDYSRAESQERRSSARPRRYYDVGTVIQCQYTQVMACRM